MFPIIIIIIITNVLTSVFLRLHGLDGSPKYYFSTNPILCIFSSNLRWKWVTARTLRVDNRYCCGPFLHRVTKFNQQNSLGPRENSENSCYASRSRCTFYKTHLSPKTELLFGAKLLKLHRWRVYIGFKRFECDCNIHDAGIYHCSVTLFLAAQWTSKRDSKFGPDGQTLFYVFYINSFDSSLSVKVRANDYKRCLPNTSLLCDGKTFFVFRYTASFTQFRNEVSATSFVWNASKVTCPRQRNHKTWNMRTWRLRYHIVWSFYLYLHKCSAKEFLVTRCASAFGWKLVALPTTSGKSASIYVCLASLIG
jgi:hypothetical protein